MKAKTDILIVIKLSIKRYIKLFTHKVKLPRTFLGSSRGQGYSYVSGKGINEYKFDTFFKTRKASLYMCKIFFNLNHPIIFFF